MANEPDDNDTYNGYSVDGDDQPQDTDDDLTGDGDGDTDSLDDANSPAEKWSVAEGFGNTPFEEATGETLDQRLAQEEPESDPYEEAEREADSEEEAAMHVIDEGSDS